MASETNPTPLYVLNGDRLKAIESDIRETRVASLAAKDAAFAAQMTVNAHAEMDAQWRAEVFTRHKEDLSAVVQLAATNAKRLDNKWPLLWMTLGTQIVAALAVSITIGKFVLPAMIAAKLAEQAVR